MLKALNLAKLEKHAAIPGISKTDLVQELIPLPPLNEQKRIAEILGGVQQSTDLVQSEITLVRSLLIKLVNNLVADMTTKKEPLGNVIFSKPDYGIGQPSADFNPKVGRYVRITDIDSWGNLEEESVSPLIGDKPFSPSKLLQSGDIIFARSGATVGKTYLHYENTVPHWFAGYLIRFTVSPEIVRPEIVFDYTKTREYAIWVDSRKQTVAQPNISAQIYAKELNVPVPTHAAQEDYMRTRNELYYLLKLLHQKLTLLQELQRSLSARAFAGQL